jgi:aspartyl-tRNA(Asn)/glutamyl-tRNA(Gln) amidotransferase subunit C
MLAAAVPRLRLGRSQWLLPRRHLLSTSAPNVTPAAGTAAGELEPPDLPRLANAARISLSPREVARPRLLFSYL